MADILIDNETVPSTPAASKSVLWVDSTAKRQLQTDDGGIHRGIFAHNNSTSAQGAIVTTEIYLTGSSLRIPSYGMQVGMTFVWYISASKTAAGVAGPVWKVYIGPNQSTADTLRFTLTSGSAAVATIWEATLVGAIQVPIASGSGTLAGSGPSAPNFGGGGTGTSGTFDNTATIGGQFIGLTVTTGASAAWTVTSVSCFGMI